jgi:hypothetical protein
MRTRFALLIVAAAILGGCASPGDFLSRAAKSTPAPGAATPIVHFTPPPLSLQQLGEAYLVVADKANKSFERLGTHRYLDTVKRIRSWCGKASEIDVEFLEGLEAIPFTEAYRAPADDLIATQKKVNALYTKCVKAKTLKAIKKVLQQIDAADAIRAEASVQLRKALYLSTRVLY